MKRRILSLLCIFSLCLALFVPAQAAGEVCFTAVNDRILPLTADSMPVWSGGLLYVPYSVFDASTTGVSMGTSSTYSRSGATVSVFNLRQMMVFDLNEGVCRNQHTGEVISGRAIIRNGTAYVPVAQVCKFFGLNYSYLYTSYGYLVRITNYDKNDSRTLSDSVFIDAGSNIMRSRLRDYNQTLAQQEDLTPTQSGSNTPQRDPEPTAVPTYLAVRCETGQSTQSIAEIMEHSGVVGLFLFPAQEIGHQGTLIRRLLGHGHSIGILAEGETSDETRELLELGSHTLETVARTRTYFALVPEDHQQDLSEDGWVFWSAGVNAIPDGSHTPYSHALNLVNSLPKKGSVKITLDDSQASTDAMTNLLRQLQNRSYTVTIPRETRL